MFFDASVLFAGCHSPQGASGLLMGAAAAGIFKPSVSQLVVAEARKALKLKSDADALLRFYDFLSCPGLNVIDVPAPDEIERYLDLISSKDCHVLASAVAAGVEFLLTLDRKHFFTPALRQAGLPLDILTPGEFLKRSRDELQSF